MRLRKTTLSIGAYLGLGLAFAWAWYGGSGVRVIAQATPSSDQQFQQLIRSVQGPDLFRAYCASCHGSDGKGHGPAAVALKPKVADLTVLAANNRGQFPVDRVRKTIMGEEVIASHGSRAMPIWGPIFHQIEEDVDRGNVRLENLVKYLESIQSIPPQPRGAKKVSANSENIPSGADLYKQHCSACHDSSSESDAPVPAPFRVPPDLRTLALRHNGQFPDEYVTSVLRNGVEMPAHGPAEMPVWGPDFMTQNGFNENQATLRIANLTSYIKSIQK